MSIARRTFLSLAAAGCLAGMAPATASADEIVKVAIGQKGLWDTMVTTHGIEEGFFKKEGLDVQITWTKGGAETLQAVATGSAAFAMANGMLGVLGAYSKGAAVRIVSAQMTGAPDLFWYSKADSGIKSLKDSNGKTMGFSRPGSSTNLVALELANASGAKPKLTPTGGISGTRTQVLSGQIDIGWSVPPFGLDLVNKGELHVVARGSDLPKLSDQTIRVNVVNADFLAKKRDVATKFMRVYAQTVDWMYKNMDATVKRYAAFNKLDAGIARNSAKFYPRNAVAPSPIKGLDLSVQQAIAYKKLKKPLSKAQLTELVQILHN
ncbi:MAG: ABC transporter substrate-binding protein [Rhodospirillales bacterium]|nr:ABC transporter substrate-binding protein [Rhodospirillales bacterium]